MNRPTDIYGNPVEMGPWYWARNRTGQIAGTGKFASCIGSGGEITWFINSVGYDPANFTFVKAMDDPEKDFAYPQAGPRHGVEYLRPEDGPMPEHLQKHIDHYMEVNQQTHEKARHGVFPLGMVQRWIERAEDEEKIVARVWKVLGVNIYADAHGKAIDELVAELKRRAEYWERLHNHRVNVCLTEDFLGDRGTQRPLSGVRDGMRHMLTHAADGVPGREPEDLPLPALRNVV